MDSTDPKTQTQPQTQAPPPQPHQQQPQQHQHLKALKIVFAHHHHPHHPHSQQTQHQRPAGPTNTQPQHIQSQQQHIQSQHQHAQVTAYAPHQGMQYPAYSTHYGPRHYAPQYPPTMPAYPTNMAYTTYTPSPFTHQHWQAPATQFPQPTTNQDSSSTPHVSSITRTPRPRQKAVITDPKTGKPIDLGEESKPDSSVKETAAIRTADVANNDVDGSKDSTINDNNGDDKKEKQEEEEVKVKEEEVKEEEVKKEEVKKEEVKEEEVKEEEVKEEKVKEEEVKEEEPREEGVKEEGVKEEGGEQEEGEQQHQQEQQQQREHEREQEHEQVIGLQYESGQYNPMSNRIGKKKYSREFLIAVGERICKLSVFDDEKEDNSMDNYSFTDQVDIFQPPFSITKIYPQANRQNDPSRRPNQQNYMGRSSAGQERQRKVIASSSLTNEVELKTVANPWRPAKDVKEEIPVDVVELEDLKKKFRSILNKLTPNNFENLSQAVTNLNIDTEDKLGEVIDIVFAKALAEPGYCTLYGRMCSHLKKTTAGAANFGNTLLKRCQNQFQSDIYSGVNVDERKQKIEDEENADVKKQLNEELYEDMYRCRMRGLGLIKFIGELYKIEMLNDTIMFDCILRLLCDTSEESLECLCDLLVTIGEKLDRSSLNSAKEDKKAAPKGSAKGNAYQSGKTAASVVAASNSAQQKSAPETITTLDDIFGQLHKIRKNKELAISLRIRFKLLDVCDLREKENWQSKKDNNPKKIEEIREAHKEIKDAERRKDAQMGPRRSQEGGSRRLGHSSGSSNQISSLANESGVNRGGSNMHASASSHSIRDHSGEEDKPNMFSQHRQNLQSREIQNILGKVASSLSNQTDKTSLRPAGQLRPMTASSGATTSLRPSVFLRPGVSSAAAANSPNVASSGLGAGSASSTPTTTTTASAATANAATTDTTTSRAINSTTAASSVAATTSPAADCN